MEHEHEEKWVGVWARAFCFPASGGVGGIRTHPKPQDTPPGKVLGGSGGGLGLSDELGLAKPAPPWRGEREGSEGDKIGRSKDPEQPDGREGAVMLGTKRGRDRRLI